MGTKERKMEFDSKDLSFVDQHVGKRLRLARCKIGLSQKELGDKVGVTFQTIQKYERGRTRVTASRLYQLSEILSVSPKFFFEQLSSEIVNLVDSFE